MLQAWTKPSDICKFPSCKEEALNQPADISNASEIQSVPCSGLFKNPFQPDAISLEVLL